MNAPSPRPPAVQIRLSTLFAVTAVVAAVFGVLKWMGASPQASLIVLAVLLLAALGAVGLLLALHYSQGDRGSRREDEEEPPPPAVQ